MRIKRYSLVWDDMDDLQIEMSCIKKGGRWKMGDGKEYGDGMFLHFRRLQDLLWPDEDNHRWSDLMLKTILENRITVVAGAKDSGKTHTMSKFALADYFCFPQETLTMMSSTDIRGLELRVWGDVKDLFDRARERWSYLPGNVVDAKHGIFTDALDDTGDVRDMRKGILCIPCIGSSGEFVGISKFVGVKQKRRRLLGDECFPAGTMVDTLFGPKPIEKIAVGDRVLSAIGFMPVIGLSVSQTMRLYEVKTKDGRKLVCTGTHPILTNRGWKKACEINEEHFILGFNECLQDLCKTNKQQAYMQQEMLACFYDHARGSEHSVYTTTQTQCECKSEGENEQRQSYETKGMSNEGEQGSESWRSSTEDSWRKWDRTHKSGVAAYEDVPRGDMELWCQNGEVERQRDTSSLQSRLGFSVTEAGNRSRRILPQQLGQPEREGQKERVFLGGSWVESVTILQQRNSGLQMSGENSGRCTVYNLQVAGHPSYSVNGLIVHNCQFMQQSYLDSMANLDKGNFLGCFVGNPIGNGDPLDKLSEPAIGWDALGEITKTTTWKNKFGGVTINFVGTDSPNFDADKPKSYPYLIDKVDVDRIGDRYGRDSALFWSQIMGVRKAGINAHRVLTMDMCNKYGAFDTCIWAGSDTTRVFGIDAGYGGDLCVGICAEFGTDVTGVTAIKFHEPVVIPVRLSAPEIVEDQIATFAKGECLRMGIPDEHVFIEAGMRATLAVSFSRIMSPKINAINFGGAATDRPVSNDLFILDDRTGQRRHKKANEHYSKYVTQLYFSVRAAVESKQVRDLPKIVAEEFCLREWYMVHGDRYELETKLECKERMGVSPNYADAAAVACEGALRLGFQIERLKIEDANTNQSDSWLDKELTADRNKRSKYQLKYG